MAGASPHNGILLECFVIKCAFIGGEVFALLD